MAERNATVKLQVRPDTSDPAAPMKAIATASRRAADETRALKDGIEKASKETRTAAGLVTSLMTAQAKKTQEAKARVEELTDALKKTGATTQQVQSFARTLGREMKLTTAQINEALQKAGQLQMATHGGFGSSGLRGGRPGIGQMIERVENRERRGLVREVVGGFGPLAMAHLVGTRLSEGVKEAQRTGGDERVKQEIKSFDDSRAKMMAGFHDGIPVLEQVRDAFTQTARAAVEASEKMVEASRSQLEFKQARIHEAIEQDAQRSRERDELAQIRFRGRDDREAVEAHGDVAFGRGQALAGNAGAFRFGHRDSEEVIGGHKFHFRDAETGNEKMALIQAQQQRQAAQAGANTSEARANAARSEFNVRGQEFAGVDARVRARIAAGDNRASTQTENANIANRQLEALRDELREIEAARSAHKKVAEAAEAEARAQYELARKTEESLRLRAEQVKAQARTTRESIEHAGVEFGSMTREDQKSTLEAARKFQKGGIGSLTEEELGKLKGTGLFDEQVKQQALARAQRSGFGELVQRSGAEGRAAEQEKRAADLQAAADKVRITAEAKLSFDEAQIATALKEILQQVDKRVLEVTTQVQKTTQLREQQLKQAPIPGPQR